MGPRPPSQFQNCGPLFGPYKSSLRVRLRNLIESVRAALNPVTPPRDDAVASGSPKSCVGHPKRPARSANLSRMAVRSRCHSGVGRVGRGQPLGDGQPRGVRGAVGQPNDRGCSATWPGRGGGSALPASSRGLAVRAPQAAQYSRARGHVVGVVIEMSGCDACLDRRVVVILEPCVRPLFAGSCQGISVGGCGVCSRA